MKVVAAYLLAVLGGNADPFAEDLKSVLESMEAEAEEDGIDLLLTQVEGIGHQATATRRFRGGDGRQVKDLKREIGRRDRLRDEKTEGFARSCETGAGITVFVPTDEAFAELPELARRGGTVMEQRTRPGSMRSMRRPWRTNSRKNLGGRAASGDAASKELQRNSSRPPPKNFTSTQAVSRGR